MANLDKRCFGYECKDAVKLTCEYYVRSIHLPPFQPDRTGYECDHYTPRKTSWGVGREEND